MRNGTVTLAGRDIFTNISAYVAQQKAGVCLLLHYGQSFSCDEATLHEIAHRLCWLVPVWFSTLTEGRQEKLGELMIDAQTGEVLDGQARCRAMKNAARAGQSPEKDSPFLS
ncbi:MAG: hypothetical protein HYZ50_14530 [Deltaproteobacteria bacterium]|nr:hypothetical protein [Deltaproteobacteria bacterium]